MTLSDGESNRCYRGEDATFSIEVFNQGTIAAHNVELTNYIPKGLSLNDTNWSLIDNMASYTLAEPIAPGTSAVSQGQRVEDIDSNFDNIVDNDAGNINTDNEIGDDGSIDEDDSEI